MSEYNVPKVTVLPSADNDFNPRVFFGEDEFAHEVWDVKVDYSAFGDHKLTITMPIDSVEFKKN